MSFIRIITLLILIFFCINGVASDKKKSIFQYTDSGDVALEHYNLDKALYYAMRAEELFNDLGIKDHLLEERIQTGFINALRLIDNKEMMITHLHKLLEINNAEGVIVSGEYFRTYGELATQYMSLNSLDSAIKYSECALKEAIKGGDPLYISSGLNNIGLYHIKKNEWEISKLYFNRAIDSLVLQDEEDSLLLCSIKDNLSDYYFYKKDSINGTNLIEQNLSYLLAKPINNKEGTFRRLIRYGLKLCNIYLKNGRLRETEYIVENLALSLNEEDKEWHLRQLIAIQRIKLRLAILNHNKDLEFKHYSAIDSLMRQKLRNTQGLNENLNKTIGDYMLGSAKREMAIIREKSNKEQEANQIKFILLVISLILFGVIVALVMINTRRKLEKESSKRLLKEKELKLTELEKEKLNAELKNQEKDLSNMVMQSTLKKDWNSEIINSLEKVSYGKAKVDSYDIGEIIRGLKQKSTAFDIVRLQEKSIKDVNTSFYTNLIELYPNLTAAEKEMCKLIRMKLGGNEIATIRNINPSSVRKLRQRLRKKMGLSPKQDIYNFIAKI